MGYQHYQGPKSQTIKTDKVHKEMELYQVFMYNFMCRTALIFSIFTLFTKRIDTFWSGGISTCSSGVIRHFGLQKQTRKIDKIHKDF